MILFDLLSVLLISSKVDSFRAAGGAVRILAAADSVDPSGCERLSALDGVNAAGAIQEQSPVLINALPGLKVPHYTLSPGAAGLLGIEDVDRPGFYLASELAAKWGLNTGAVVATDAGPVELLGTFDYDETDGRDPRLANAFVDIAVMESASECWVEIWPAAGSSYDGLLHTAVSPDAVLAAEAQIFPFNPDVHAGADGNLEFKQRPTKLVLIAIVMVTAIVAAAGTLRRSLEMSSNLHAGAKHLDLLMVTLFEALIGAVVVALTAMAIVAWTLRVFLPAATGQLLPAYVSTTLLAMLGALLGAIAPVAFQSEERLFSSFKRRT
ncbi:MAG: hypothetical protein ACK4XK_12205 [Casimicrobiaceae bacterium]